MMGVMEEQVITTGHRPVAADGLYQPMLVPFMDQYQVGVGQLTIEVERLPGVLPAAQPRICLVKPGDCIPAVVPHQMFPAPPQRGLHNRHLMAASLQLGHYASQEMGIAVVPVRHQGVVEHHDAHADS
jgi:hypothetical protein